MRRRTFEALALASLALVSAACDGEQKSAPGGAESHKAFIDKYKLPFPLVVDTDGSVAKAFHVPMRGAVASRQSFLIGKDGKIKQVWLDVDPKEHAAAIVAAAKS